MARSRRETKLNAMVAWVIKRRHFTLQEFCETWDCNKNTARVYISRIKDRLEEQGIVISHVNYWVVGDRDVWCDIIDKL